MIWLHPNLNPLREHMETPSSESSVWIEVSELAAKLRQEDRSALTRLYDVCGPRLLRYAEAITKNRADAEDVLQSSLVRIARKPESFAYSDRPWAYLVRIVRNESLKLLESRKKRFSMTRLIQLWRSTECPAEQAESKEKIQDAIHKLPPEQAEVVVLKIWEDFTFSEIADLIGESPNTAASRYRYAIEKLSRSLQSLSLSHQLAAHTRGYHDTI
jgi:RNA polymerase sigma-70 factor (ECF subfamily)